MNSSHSMWNPFQDIAGSWGKTASGWGKVSVITFYPAVWTPILLNLWSIIDPPKNEVFACVFVGGAHQSMMPYIVMILRQWELFIIGFFLFVVQNGLKLGNVAMVFLVHLASLFIMVSFNIKNSNSDFDCYKDFLAVEWSFLALLAIAWVTLFFDEWIKTSQGSPAEMTPLYH